MDDKTKLSLALKRLRRMKGYNQGVLAKLSGISRVTISDYEQAISTPKIDSLRKLSNAFGMSVEQMLDEGEKEHHERESQKSFANPVTTPPTSQSGQTHDLSAVLFLLESVHREMIRGFARIEAILEVKNRA
jgi:transcriptional regulator with XRE-family HTH domain